MRYCFTNRRGQSSHLTSPLVSFASFPFIVLSCCFKVMFTLTGPLQKWNAKMEFWYPRVGHLHTFLKPHCGGFVWSACPLWGICGFFKKKKGQMPGGDGHSWNWWWGGRGLKWCYKGIITSISLFLCFFHLHYSNLCVYSPPKIFPFILIKQLCSNSSSSNLTCR